jgi:hypothetical protein
MGVPEAPSRVLVLGQFDLGDIVGVEELAEVVLGAGVGDSADKEF